MDRRSIRRLTVEVAEADDRTAERKAESGKRKADYFTVRSFDHFGRDSV